MMVNLNIEISISYFEFFGQNILGYFVSSKVDSCSKSNPMDSMLLYEPWMNWCVWWLGAGGLVRAAFGPFGRTSFSLSSPFISSLPFIFFHLSNHLSFLKLTRFCLCPSVDQNNNEDENFYLSNFILRVELYCFIKFKCTSQS